MGEPQPTGRGLDGPGQDIGPVEGGCGAGRGHQMQVNCI